MEEGAGFTLSSKSLILAGTTTSEMAQPGYPRQREAAQIVVTASTPGELRAGFYALERKIFCSTPMHKI